MSNSGYYIIANCDVWMVQFRDAENGQYKSNEEAASFAIATAQNFAMRGERVHVCLLDDDGNLQCKWSYNQDRLYRCHSECAARADNLHYDDMNSDASCTPSASGYESNNGK